MSTYLEAELRAAGNVAVVEGAEVTQFEPRGPAVRMTLTTGQTLDVSAVFIFIGADPQTAWLPLAKDAHGYVLTGVHLPDVTAFGQRRPFGHETSLPGVFAAGDVRSGSVKRVAGAAGEGAAAIADIHQYLALTGRVEMPAAPVATVA